MTRDEKIKKLESLNVQMIGEPSDEQLDKALAFYSEDKPTVSQWIPCSERLPELKKWVLVSSGDCVVSDCLVVRGGNKIWYECGRIDIEHDAWMPLPEPYKEDTK